ncbi:hypothetical protein QFZ23_003581 [Arthrobacter globiformis]|uniref:hypothetical protein n=1 Tax=Arthrobacter globiformis TaxID=1665 RepID=UPI0027834D8D|nr:hypothetical protein [Arthrobacter globiformis]MDQ1059680.1 hypothetical protein [Arthrobacter globiformis]
MPIQFELPPMALLGPLLAAVGIYGLLRWVVWAPGAGTSPKSVSDHVLWVGVIGWLASTLQGAANAGIIPLNPQTPSLQQPADILKALAWPVAGCLGVHALGQLSYPGPRSPRRLATLSVRRVRDSLPRKLAWTTLGIFAASAATIAWTAMQQAYRPLPYASPPYGESGPTVGGDGRIAGTELAACLGAALLLLAAGTMLVLWLISRRRQLEALNAGDNVLLRTIAMNRLLRTVSTVAAGLAAIAGNYATRPDPAVTTTWINPVGLVPVVVLFVMWLWQPPQLAGVQNRNVRSGRASPSGRKNVRNLRNEKHPAAVLTVSLGALLGLAAVAPGTAVLFLLGSTNPVRATVVSAVMASCVLLAILAGELLLERNYGASPAVRGWPVQPVAPALLTAAIIGLLLLAVVIVMTSVGEAALPPGTSVAPGWIPTAVATAAVAVTAVPATQAARRRRGIVTSDDGLDAALRAVTLNRIVRILAAVLLAQAGGLLISANRAWGVLLGTQTVPAEMWEASAAAAGYVLVAAAVVLSLIHVTAFGPGSAPAARRAPVEPAR